MEAILGVINKILALGASVIMPIVICIMELIFGMKPKNAIRSGLTVGIGFVGVNLAVGLIGGNLGNLIAALQDKYHLALSITDVGWPAGSSIAFGSGTFVVISILVFMLVNAVSVLLKLTNTLNIDIFNYWHHILIGTMSWFVSGSMVVGVIVGAVFMLINTILADKHEETFVDYGGERWRGLSFPSQGIPLQMYFVRGVNWVLDRIPVIRDINFNFGKLPGIFSFLGEPMILGFLLGGIFSLAVGYAWDKALSVAVSMAAAMYILPRMVSIMMEGLSPLTDVARDFMNKKFAGRKLNISIDTALLVGDPDVITMGVIMVPVVLGLAFILPGNKFLPFTDLPALPYWVIPAVYGTKHNSFRALISATLCMAISLYIATDLAPLITQMATNVGFEFAQGTTISGFFAGWEWPGYILHKIVELIF